MSARDSVRAVLLDLEGTLYAKGAALPGAAAAVRALREAGVELRFVTNIDSRPAAAIAGELASIGLDVPADELFTPLTAARALFASIAGARVLPLLSLALHGELVGLHDDGPHSHVLVGDCRDIVDYAALDGAFRALRAGAELVAMQYGRYFIRADGDHIDTGAFVAALEYAAGVRARVLGKPSLDFFALAARSAGVDIAQCLVVGDDATTDIAGGRAAGAWTIQLRTGKYAQQAADGLTGLEDVALDSIADVPEVLVGMLR